MNIIHEQPLDNDKCEEIYFNNNPTTFHLSSPPETPPRSTRMPTEIKVTPGTPDSNYSALSGTTGFVFDNNTNNNSNHHHYNKKHLNSNGKSMFKSVLPEMTSETEECSIDRSTFTWTAYQQSHDSDDHDLIHKKLSFGSPSTKNSKFFSCDTVLCV